MKQIHEGILLSVLSVAFVLQIFAIKIFDTWINLPASPNKQHFLKKYLKNLFLMMTG